MFLEAVIQDGCVSLTFGIRHFISSLVLVAYLHAILLSVAEASVLVDWNDPTLQVGFHIRLSKIYSPRSSPSPLTLDPFVADEPVPVPC